jgi:hypothetical protein
MAIKAEKRRKRSVCLKKLKRQRSGARDTDKKAKGKGKEINLLMLWNGCDD